MTQILKSSLWFIILVLGALATSGQDHHERYKALDVVAYRFEIGLNDSCDVIHGKTDIEIAFREELEAFYLDLAYDPEKGTGMKVSQVSEDGKKLHFIQQDNRLIISIPAAQKESVHRYEITYGGVPSDGLIIAKNKFGDRTFFGDNWPNRGHHWLPLVDHPSDKAKVEFIVSAPDHYGIVAVGKKISETKENGMKNSHWQSSVPLSSKLMVIGVSPFAVKEWESSSGIPVSTWVYPQNKEEGFYDYSIATRPLDFFESYIAPYPYSKLANVQSKTIYGGMENASCIFYHERTVTGKQDHELLFAHEIAHQWFGDAVSELDWHHIWLSEGFATYLTDIYIEQTHGRDAFVSSMLDEKGQVIRYARRRLAPIVDTSLPVSARLLNKNTYEKAGWVLHMLRHDMGDEIFQELVQSFYKKFKFGNVLTEDFQEMAESVSGKSYDTFFKQWFYQPGHPVLSAKWKNRGKQVLLTITQHQEHPFEFSIEVDFTNSQGETFRETLSIHDASQSFRLKTDVKISEIKLDPDSWLLFENYDSP